VVEVLIASTFQETNRGRSDVEMSQFVFVDHIPVPREGRIRRSSLEDESAQSEQKRSVDDVGMSGDPTDVASRANSVALVSVEDIFSRGSRSNEISSASMQDTLWFACRSRRVEKEQGILGVHDLRRTIRTLFDDFLMPPKITTFGPRNLGACSTEDENIPDMGAFLQCVVDDFLGANGFPTTTALIGGQDDTRVCVIDTIAQGFRGEAGKDDGMECAETNDCEEGDDGLGNHGHVNCDSIALFDAQFFEHIGQFTDFSEKFAVRDLSAMTGFIRFVQNGNLTSVSRKKWRMKGVSLQSRGS